MGADSESFRGGSGLVPEKPIPSPVKGERSFFGEEMTIGLADEYRMLQALAAKFVDHELMPLEPAVLAREMSGQPIAFTEQEEARRARATAMRVLFSSASSWLPFQD